MNLSITYNPSLATCEVQSICAYLANPSGIVNIYRNAPGCNNPPEIANACDITLSCLPFGNYYFLSQSEIDNFVSDYPGCTILNGDVIIKGYYNAITSLDGLDVVTSIGQDLLISDSNFMTSLTGLENLTSIGRALQISHCDSLTSLTSLENLTSIGGDLGIWDNDVLTSLTGIDNISANSIYDLNIANNNLLSICAVQSICNYLINPNGDIFISNNPTGCHNQQEVLAACAVGLVDEIDSNDHFLIYPNPARDFITISYEHEAAVHRIMIYNLLGEIVYAPVLSNNTIDVSKLQPGMYVIEIITSEFKIRKKLIKG